LSQFRLRAETRPHEVGIGSNRGSASRGEYVLGSCTHRQIKTRMAAHITNRLKSYLVVKKIRQARMGNQLAGGSETKSSQTRNVYTTSAGRSEGSRKRDVWMLGTAVCVTRGDPIKKGAIA